MKTTLQLPDQLLRDAKASAAVSHGSLKEFICGAIRDKLRNEKKARAQERGWRAVFGRATSRETAKIDRVVEAEFSRIDEESWR